MQITTLPQIEIDNSTLLSLGKSAQLLGMDRLSFIELLKQDDIPIFNYSDREMSELFDDADSLVDFQVGIHTRAKFKRYVTIK